MAAAPCYKSLPIEFKVEQAEWDAFWSWMWYNTGCHFIGPLTTRRVEDGLRQQKINEQAMNLFLTHKNQILLNPPTGVKRAEFNNLCMSMRTP